MPVNTVQSMGWTRRSAAVSVLLAMEEHRKAAGQRVRRLREAQKLTQEELAPRAKVSVKTLSRFENGRHDGRRTTVRRIAKALGVDEADIVGEPPAPLGLGESQLDRIEAKLDRVLSLLHAEEAHRIAAEAEREQSPPAPRRRTA